MNQINSLSTNEMIKTLSVASNNIKLLLVGNTSNVLNKFIKENKIEIKKMNIVEFEQFSQFNTSLSERYLILQES